MGSEISGYRCCVPVSSIAPWSHLQSAAVGELVSCVTCGTKTIEPRAFAVSCPTRWNALPSEMCLFFLSIVDYIFSQTFIGLTQCSICRRGVN